MACGIPLVWFDQPALREATGGHGIPGEPDDVPAMRSALRTLLHDASERARLGGQGRRYISGIMGWDRVWDQWECLLHAVA